MDTAPRKNLTDSQTTNENAPVVIALTKTYARLQDDHAYDQFANTILSLHRRLRRFTSQYEIYPECTDDGNVHYHAVLYIRDEYGYFNYGLRALKADGFIKAKTVRDLSGWRCYCTKKGKAYAIRLFDLEGLYPITRDNIRMLRKRMESKRRARIQQAGRDYGFITVPGFDNIVYKNNLLSLLAQAVR